MCVADVVIDSRSSQRARRVGGTKDEEVNSEDDNGNI